MQEAVIVAGVRTAIGRVGGALKETEVDYLQALISSHKEENLDDQMGTDIPK